MIVVLPPELKAMEDKVEPYIVKDGFNVYLSPSAPPEIVEMDKKVMAFYDRAYAIHEKESLRLA